MKDKNNYNIKIIILMVVIFLACAGGLTYAYFDSNIIGNEEASSAAITTADMELIYNDIQILSGNNIEPGWNVTKTLTVTNNSEDAVNYIFKLREVLNTITNNELVISATCVSSSGTCNSIPETPIPLASTEMANVSMFGPVSIGAGVTHTYTLTVTFKNTGSVQNYNKGKRFYFTLNVGPEAKINGVSTYSMTQSDAAQYYGQVVSTVNSLAFDPNSDDSRTWKVFYIDTANKYGDGKGTIYLKADNDSNKVVRFNTRESATQSDFSSNSNTLFSDTNIAYKFSGVITNTSVANTAPNIRYYRIEDGNVVDYNGNIVDTKYLKLNPTYATGRAAYNISFPSSLNLFESEKTAAYLCDPYYFSSYTDSRTKYAIGTPPVEMYIDSWNALYSSNQMDYRFNTQADGTNDQYKLPGYELYPNTGGWGTSAKDWDLNALDTVNMYKTTSGLYLASPATILLGKSLVRVSSSSTVGIGNTTINFFYEFSPVIALSSDVNVRTTSYAGN